MLTQQMKDTIEKQRLGFVATVSATISGEPKPEVDYHGHQHELETGRLPC